MNTSNSRFFVCTANPAESTIHVYAYALGTRTNLLFRAVSEYAWGWGLRHAYDGNVGGEYRVRVLVPCPGFSKALVPHFERISTLVGSALVARDVARLEHQIVHTQAAAAALA